MIRMCFTSQVYTIALAIPLSPLTLTLHKRLIWSLYINAGFSQFYGESDNFIIGIKFQSRFTAN